MKNNYQKLPKCYIGKIGVPEISFLENFYYQQDESNQICFLRFLWIRDNIHRQ